MGRVAKLRPTADVAARNRAVEATLHVVENVVKRYRARIAAGLARGGPDEADTFQAGALALIDAYETYDAGRGEWESYAAWKVQARVRSFLAASFRGVVLKQSAYRKAAAFRARKAEIERSTGRTPTDREVLDAIGACGLSRRSTLAAARANQADRDAEAPLFAPEIPDPDAADEAAWRLSLIPEKPRRVASVYFGLSDGKPRTIDETARDMGRSRAYVTRHLGAGVEAMARLTPMGAA